MFEATHPFPFFDYLRVPYDVTAPAGAAAAPLGAVTAPATGRRLYWTRPDKRVGRRGLRAGRYRLGDFTIAGHVDTASVRAPLGVPGGGWEPAGELDDAHGRTVAAVWRDGDGNVFLPFDPGEVMGCLWSEGYTTIGGARLTRSLRAAMVRTYYAVRPLLPRPVQLRMRRAFAARQTVPEFPAWPAEHSLHDLYDWLHALLAELAGEPLPWIDLWPDGRSWAMVLTHDVETAAGRDDIELLRGPEREHGYRSSWNFVPERYDVAAATVDRLVADGCEVGVHGLRHDGKDLASRRMLARRLPAMRAAAERWGAVGFRSPATQRHWELMPLMGFDYDSSYTDTDPYEPQPGGCCTYLPFVNDGLVELPISLPQDHTLFEILGHSDGALWVSKARELRDRHGMVLVLAHPDYARDDRMLGAWRQLLAEFAGDETAWQALPREVARWWRDRADSRLRRDGDGWTVEGPAAGRARVRTAPLVDAGA